MDRDEYLAAIGRSRGKGLVRGSDRRGWRAHVAYVPSRVLSDPLCVVRVTDRPRWG